MHESLSPPPPPLSSPPLSKVLDGEVTKDMPYFCRQQVAYREAITKPAEVDYTHKKQSGGSGQFARVKIKFEPATMDEEGSTSDFVFESAIKGGVVPKEYIPGVQKAR